MNKIVIKENGELVYKNMSEECILSIKNKMEKTIQKLKPSFIKDEDIKVEVDLGSGGAIIICIKNHIFRESFCNICEAPEITSMQIYKFLNSIKE